MQVETAMDPSASEKSQRAPGFRQTIQVACRLAVETEDYLSFATVIDLYLGNPDRFTNEEATEVLTELLATLNDYPIILYRIGWDLMEQLLKYVDHFSHYDVENLPSQRPFLLTMALFSLLCEKGNPRELLVKACELMQSTEISENIRKLESLKISESTDDRDKLYEKMEQQGSGASFENIDVSVQGFDTFDNLDSTQQQNIKFCTLFEVIRFSLQRIETPYPSSFLLEAAQTLLQVADDPNADLLSTATYARRMFLLARDFSFANEDSVSPEEMVRVRNILVNFVTHTAFVILRKYSIKWAQRLYIQMCNKVALAPPTERDFVYQESEQTRRMSEVFSRLAQLLLSYDFDPAEHMPPFCCNMVTNSVVPEAPPDYVAPTRVEGCEVLADNYWSRQLLNGPSIQGMGQLKTQLHFDGTRANDKSWSYVANHVINYECRMMTSAGCRDAMLYWSLWAITRVDSETFAHDLDEPLLKKWLSVLLKYVGTSVSRGEKFVSGSVISRALRLLPSQFAFDYCLDVMRTSSDSSQQFVIVESLKVLLTGKLTCNSESGQEIKCPNAEVRTLQLTKEQITELTVVSGEAIKRIKKETHKIAYYYLNFLAVVPTDPDALIQITDDLNAMNQHCMTYYAGRLPAECLMKLQMLRTASDQLRQLAMDRKAHT